MRNSASEAPHLRDNVCFQNNQVVYVNRNKYRKRANQEPAHAKYRATSRGRKVQAVDHREHDDKDEIAVVDPNCEECKNAHHHRVFDARCALTQRKP